MASEEPTKDELQDELRKRDLPVSGTKAELQDRLEDAEGGSGGGSAKKATKKATKKASKKATRQSAKKTTKKATKKTSKKSAKKATKKSSTSPDSTDDTDRTSTKQATAKMQTSSQQTDDSQQSQETERSGGSSPSGSSSGGRPRAGEIARLAARQLAELTRHKIEGISGLSPDEDGWRVEVEVVEVHRVPSSTDVMGTYAVYVDGDGGLTSYERVERFVRGQASGGGGEG